MWGFFICIICKYMLYSKEHLIKNNRIDLGELYWDVDDSSIKHSSIWNNYEYAKSLIYKFLENYNELDVIWVENVEGRDYRFTNPNLYRFFLDYYKDTGKKIILKTNALNIDYGESIIHYPCFGFMGGVPSYEITERTFKNKILFLNRVERWHRTKLYLYFYNKNLLKYFDYSINSDNSSHEYFKSIELDEIEMDSIMNILPNYFTCFLSLITETHFNNNEDYDNILFFTEKLDKVLAVGQPFIIATVPHYIKTLKKLGFKTFDKWWDESYDNIIPQNDRLLAIGGLVENICQWDIDKMERIYKEMIPTLIHNQRLAKFIGDLHTPWNDYTLDDIVYKVNKYFN